MVVVADTGQLENRRAPTTTLEGWRSFINSDPSELALLPRDQHDWWHADTAVSDATHAIHHALRAGTRIPGQQQRLRRLAPAHGNRNWPACSASAAASQATPPSRSRSTPTSSGSPRAASGRTAPGSLRHCEAPR